MDSDSLEVLGDGDTQSATDSQKRYWNSEPLAFEENTGVSDDFLVMMFSHRYQPQPGAPWLWVGLYVHVYSTSNHGYILL